MDAVAGDRDRPPTRPGDADEPHLLLGDGARHDVQAGQLGREADVVPGRELLPGHHTPGLDARRPGDGGGGTGMVARDDEDLDPGLAHDLDGLADIGPHRVGEGDHGQWPPVPLGAGTICQQDEPLARARASLDEVAPR